MKKLIPIRKSPLRDLVVLHVFVMLFSTISQVVSLNELRSTFVPYSTNCSNLRLAHFLSFFPCVNVSSVEDLAECDVFAYVASELAVERINRNPEILGGTLVRLAPISDVVTSQEVMFAYIPYLHI